MTKDEMLIKLEQIKKSTQSIMEGGIKDAEVTGNDTEDKGKSK